MVSIFSHKKLRYRNFDVSFPKLDSSSGRINFYSLRSKELKNIVIKLINEKRKKFRYSIPEIPGRQELSIKLMDFANSSSRSFEGTIKEVKIGCSEGYEKFILEENRFLFTCRKPTTFE